jgi:hypothetical protein
MHLNCTYNLIYIYNELVSVFKMGKIVQQIKMIILLIWDEQIRCLLKSQFWFLHLKSVKFLKIERILFWRKNGISILTEPIYTFS